MPSCVFLILRRGLPASLCICIKRSVDLSEYVFDCQDPTPPQNLILRGRQKSDVRASARLAVVPERHYHGHGEAMAPANRSARPSQQVSPRDVYIN